MCVFVCCCVGSGSGELSSGVRREVRAPGVAFEEVTWCACVFAYYGCMCVFLTFRQQVGCSSSSGNCYWFEGFNVTGRSQCRFVSVSLRVVSYCSSNRIRFFFFEQTFTAKCQKTVQNTICVTLQWNFIVYKTAKINYSKRDVKIINYAYKVQGFTSERGGSLQYIAVSLFKLQFYKE